MKELITGWPLYYDSLKNTTTKVEKESNINSRRHSRSHPISVICNRVKEVQLKFVVKGEIDLYRISEWLGSISVDLPPIIIQPERFTFEKDLDKVTNRSRRIIYLDKMIDLIKWCNKHLSSYDYRVLPQLHYLIFKGSKGT